MKKEQLKMVRIIAIIFSCLVASLTLCNLITVTTHGVNFELPENEDDVKIAYDPLNNDLLFITDFQVKNQGTYDINDIDIKANLYNEKGNEIIDFIKNDLVVSRGSNKNFEIVVSLDLDKVSLSEWLSLIYKDTYFKLNVDVDATYMFHLIDVTVDEEIIFPWTSPLTKFIENNSIIKDLISLIENSSAKKVINKSEDVDLVKKLLKNRFYEETYKELYKLEFEVFNISNFSKKIITKIQAYLPKIEVMLNLEFSIDIKYDKNVIFSEIKGVSIDLW